MTQSRCNPLRTGALLGALVLMPSVALSGVITSSAGAATPTTIGLGTAGAVSVLAGAGVTNTGPSVLSRDLATSPTPAITGFPPGLVLGATHAADAVAVQAQSDLTTAYNAAASAPSTNDVTGVDLGGQTLTQGVYTASSSMALTGPVPLTLNGDPSSVFIFQAGSTLITGSNTSVLLTGGAQACNVFWQVGSSATLGTNSSFVGTILAQASIGLTTGATIDGRALARTGSVTLQSNVFTHSACSTTSPSVPPAPPAPPITPPVGTPITATTGTPSTTTASSPVTTPPASSPVTNAAGGTSSSPVTTRAVGTSSSPVTTPAVGTSSSPVPRRGGTTKTTAAAPRGGGSTLFDTPSVPAVSGPPRTGGAPSRTAPAGWPGPGLLLVSAAAMTAVGMATTAGRRSLRARR